MIAGLYVRVSSEEQYTEGFSIPAQIRALQEYCTKNEIEIYETYIEEGVTGQIENRPAFQRMLKDAADKKFHVILVHKFDRFARKVEISRRIKTQLKDNGINVISITEPVEDSPIGFFQEGLLELLAEYYVRNLSREVKKGMSQRALEGLHMGQLPFGYSLDNGNIIINEEQARIVKLIFEKYNDGWGHNKISKWLNDNRIPTCKGTIWTTIQIKQCLRNPKYIGKMIWDKRLYDSKFQPIIDIDVFYTTQRQLDKKGKEYTFRGKNFDKFILLGLLRCGSCGSSMRIKSVNAGKPHQYFAYICHNAALYRGCKSTKLHRHNLLEAAIENEIGDILDEKIKDIEIETKINVSDIYSNRLSGIDKELSRAREAYLAGAFTLDEFKQSKERLETERDILHLELNKTAVDRQNELQEQLKNNIKTDLDDYHKAGSILDKKKILQRHIVDILVYTDGKLRIKFRN